MSLWCEWNWPADVHPMACTTKICPPVPRRPHSIAWAVVPWQMTRMWEEWCFSNESNHISLVQFSHTVMSDSMRPHGLQRARPPCPSLTPGVHPTHVHWVGDAIQPSHPLSSPSPPAFNLSQRQGLFQWISSSHQVAKVLQFQLQHQSFQWIFRIDFL